MAFNTTAIPAGARGLRGHLGKGLGGAFLPCPSELGRCQARGMRSGCRLRSSPPSLPHPPFPFLGTRWYKNKIFVPSLSLGTCAFILPPGGSQASSGDITSLSPRKRAMRSDSGGLMASGREEGAEMEGPGFWERRAGWIRVGTGRRTLLWSASLPKWGAARAAAQRLSRLAPGWESRTRPSCSSEPDCLFGAGSTCNLLAQRSEWTPKEDRFPSGRSLGTELSKPIGPSFSRIWA